MITVRLRSSYGVKARVMIDEETGTATTDDPSDELTSVVESANVLAGGPAPWRGVLDRLEEWATREGVALRHDAPEFPSDPEVVY